MGYGEEREDVEVEAGMGGRDGDVDEGHAIAGAGVVDEHVQAAAGERRDGGDACFDGFWGEDVEGEGLDPKVFKMGDFGWVARGREDAVPVAMESLGEGVSETMFGAAGYEDGFLG